MGGGGPDFNKGAGGGWAAVSRGRQAGSCGGQISNADTCLG